MLYYISLEKLQERYTISMDKLLRAAFKESNIKFISIEGNILSSRIQNGAFLDFAGTNYFKSSQINSISKLFFENKIKDGDTFFFSDLWFPGIDALPYMARLAGIKINIVGYQYAGSWTPSDFVSVYLKDYCQYIEHGWLEFFTNIYLCSKFQKKEMIQHLLKTNLKDHKLIAKKIIPTRLPFDYKYVRTFYTNQPKEMKVIFPHRFHWEKGADKFLEMAEYVSNELSDVTFVITSGRGGSVPLGDTKEINTRYKLLKQKLKDRLVYKSGLSKDDFYRELNTARVVWSGALQENFGYSVLECCTLGVTPVLPNRVVYPEFYPRKYMYKSQTEGLNMVIKYLKKPEPVDQEILKKIDGTSNMVKSLKMIINAK